MLYIYPYTTGSKSVKELKEGLGAKVIKREGSKFQPGPGKTVINWGCSELPRGYVGNSKVVNNPQNVRICSNKLSFFQLMSKKKVNNIPDWTTDIKVARDWLNKGSMVVCRTILNGHSGAGIVIADHPDKLVDAPLYVKYMKKKEEYRIHIFQGKIFNEQRKARVKEVQDNEVNWHVRNLKGGFIYQRNDFKVPAIVREAALEAFNATDLDFGAVDVIYNATNGKAYVLEINTAPGLTGTTTKKYTEVLANV